MQPLATDMRYYRRLAVSGAGGELGDAVAEYKDRGKRQLYFFPAAKTVVVEEMGVSIAETRYVVKAPYSRDFRPGDRLADRDGNHLYEVVSETTYPTHQRLEVRPL